MDKSKTNRELRQLILSNLLSYSFSSLFILTNNMAASSTTSTSSTSSSSNTYSLPSELKHNQSLSLNLSEHLLTNCKTSLIDIGLSLKSTIVSKTNKVLSSVDFALPVFPSFVRDPVCSCIGGLSCTNPVILFVCTRAMYDRFSNVLDVFGLLSTCNLLITGCHFFCIVGIPRTVVKSNYVNSFVTDYASDLYVFYNSIPHAMALCQVSVSPLAKDQLTRALDAVDGKKASPYLTNFMTASETMDTAFLSPKPILPIAERQPSTKPATNSVKPTIVYDGASYVYSDEDDPTCSRDTEPDTDA